MCFFWFHVYSEYSPQQSTVDTLLASVGLARYISGTTVAVPTPRMITDGVYMLEQWSGFAVKRK